MGNLYKIMRIRRWNLQRTNRDRTANGLQRTTIRENEEKRTGRIGIG